MPMATPTKIFIGYAVPGLSLTHPAFRRRAAYFLQSRAYHWEIADFNQRYDVVIVHHSADITLWAKYDKAPIILDYNDDYLITEGTSWMDRLRGPAKFASRQWRHWHADFRSAYAGMASRANAVVCCAPGASARLAPYCANRHIIMDMQPDPDWAPKTQYDVGATANLVWEGFPGFQGIADMLPALCELKRKRAVALHLITTLRQPRYMNRFCRYETKDAVAKSLPIRDVHLYEWNAPLFPKLVTACDLAIIPIDMNSPMWVGKPANKLISFWRLGMPTLVSPTPAYRELMREAGLDMLCATPADWETRLGEWLDSHALRAQVGARLVDFANTHYSNAVLLSRWDAALASVL